MIRIDALWLCAAPMDMRSGTERLLAHVVHALGRAHGRNAVATDALHRIAQFYRVERALAALPAQARQDSRQAIT